MITSCDTQEFVPFGREYLRRHPGQFQIQRKKDNPIVDHGTPLIKSFKNISIQESVKNENWVFRQHKDGSNFDEELYVHNSTVVWSRGGQNNVRTVVKSFTMETPVLQALWGSFILSSTGQSTLDNTVGQTQSGICVIEERGLTFFMDEGGEYFSPLPFQVANSWSIKTGLLFERTLTQNEITYGSKQTASLLFSMLHPLDDVAQVIMKTTSGGGAPKVSYTTDTQMALLFTCSEPSIAFSYDKSQGIHSVWKIRRPREDEINQLISSRDMSFLNATSINAGASFNLSSSYSRAFANISSSATAPGNLSSFSPRRISDRVMSPAGIVRSSPHIGHGLSSLSASSNSNIFRFQTPTAQRSPGIFMHTPGSVHNMSMGGLPNESFLLSTGATLQPNVCLEQIWTETGTAGRFVQVNTMSCLNTGPNQDLNFTTERDGAGALGKASKTFLTQDMCGQQFLCFVVPFKQQLRCLKFEESNDGKQLIFGSLTYLHAKDATPIESQNILLVLETSGILVLYNGIKRISQVHIPVLPLGSGSLGVLRSATTPMGSPVRGEVITSSRPPSAMDVRFGDEMNHISPVVPSHEDTSINQSINSSLCSTGGLVTPGNSLIQSLKDNVGKKFSVELLNGTYCRTELPHLTNMPGIDLCLKALKHLLPKDVALQVLGHWYTIRNSPGSVGNVSEWSIFSRCILGLMGYDTGKLQLTSKNERDGASSPHLHSKKAKQSEDQGTDEDWEKLLQSDHHILSKPSLGILGIRDNLPIGDQNLPSRPCAINNCALLFQFCPAILIAFHMVYEEMKLNVLLHKDLSAFAPLVHQVACDLRCSSYSDGYRRDFPELFNLVDDMSQVTEDDLKKMQYPQIFPSKVPTVAGWISQALTTGRQTGSMPYIPLVCESIRKIVSVYAVLFNEDLSPELAVQKCLKKIASAGHRPPTAENALSVSSASRFHQVYSQAEKIVLAVCELGMSKQDLDCLPIGISLPIKEACLVCRSNPPPDWPRDAYVLIGRQDLSELAAVSTSLPSFATSKTPPKTNETGTKEEDDGMEYLDEEVLKLRFPKDLRLQEVRRMLQSARPVTIAVKQRPEVSDHDFIEEQEKALLAISMRTMALPVGRGMFTLHTCQPSLTEILPIPKLCLTGKAPPRNTTVEIVRIEVPTNMNLWPMFHNGVAAGLRIADTSKVDSAWIIYNKPKELTSEFAGFLMALGLNTHLLSLSILSIHEYLSEGRSASNELITIGILLGMACAHRGTMDMRVTKALSVHVPALLPSGSTELHISHNIKVAAIMGIGLLYQGTGHLPMAEVMLAEIGRPPGPEMENCIDRDSYALSAGLSLGLILFGKGNQMTGFDLSLADILCHLMVGGHTKQVKVYNNLNHYSYARLESSWKIYEGDSVNVDVTSPGATLALGMIFFNTGNSAVSEWLKAPGTQFMLDQVRPDFLCLRTISHGLINWQAILPTTAWVDGNIPEIVKQYAFYKSQPSAPDLDPTIDIQTMSQAYCNITSGACLVLAFKFAGSGNKEAFKTLRDSLRNSLKLLGDQTLLEQAGRSTVENSISTKLLSLAIVMAGTGNLVTLRICRALRRRVGPQYHQSVYGNQMCHAMATGLLFLGGGKFTLRTTPDAIGAMLCAFYPQFPLSSTDNRCHLQAFRHFYVLACEPRLVIPRDVDTGRFCYVPLRIKFKGCASYKALSYDAGAPYIVPELSKVEEIQVFGARYWPITFREDKNWEILKQLLQKGGILPVKQKAGHMSYTEDPKGYRSLLAKSLTADQSWHTTLKADVVKSFTSDAKVAALAELFIKRGNTDKSVIQSMSDFIYQCITQDKAESIGPHFILKQISLQFSESQNTLGLSQLRLVISYYLSRYRLAFHSSNKEKMLHTEFLLSLRCHIEVLLDDWLQSRPDALVTYLQGQRVRQVDCEGLAQYLVWFSMPSREALMEPGISECPPLPVLARMFPQLSMAAVMRLHSQMATAS